MTKQLYTCPCCGYRTLRDFPGSYGICHVCFWEDDEIQILDPWYDGGANNPCLVDAQKNFILFGACEECFKGSVKGVLPGDELDPDWRPVKDKDRSSVRSPRNLSEEEFGNLDVWYYWRRNST